MKTLILTLLTVLAGLTSPDGRMKLSVSNDADSHLYYSVSLDGRPLACLWEPPYRVQLPEGTSGRVKLSVTVVNTWPNRLIGDAIARKQGAHEDWRDGYPAWVLDDKPDSGTGIYTWSNFDWGWTANDKPLPAGLIGPVRLTRSER